VWTDELLRNCPESSQIYLLWKLHTTEVLPLKIVAKKFGGYFCNFRKLAKENSRPMGENSPNMVTLFGNILSCRPALFDGQQKSIFDLDVCI
jgi:hypothetical protein